MGPCEPSSLAWVFIEYNGLLRYEQRGRPENLPSEACVLRRNEVSVSAIGALNARGLATLTAGSSRPKSAAPVLDRAKLEQLRAILHQSPRVFGQARSTWTLTLLAQVAHEQGLSATRLSAETIRQALVRLAVAWKRAKRWLTSPDPAYARKKVAATV